MCLGETYNEAWADKHDTFPTQKGLKKKVLITVAFEFGFRMSI